MRADPYPYVLEGAVWCGRVSVGCCLQLATVSATVRASASASAACSAVPVASAVEAPLPLKLPPFRLQVGFNVSHCRRPQIYPYPISSPESSLCSATTLHLYNSTSTVD